MPKTLTFLISLVILTTIFVLTDWKIIVEKKETQENFVVSIQVGNAFEKTSAQNEYFAIVVKPKNGKVINISNWSVANGRGQSLKLPEAVSKFRQGEISESEEIKTMEESFLIIATGQSPVGVSFRENLCGGFLGQYQSFTPSLPVAPLGYESYNACLDHLGAQGNFLSNHWRIFLGQSEELWLNSNEVIALFDENGQELVALNSPSKTFSDLTKKVLENMRGFMIELK